MQSKELLAVIAVAVVAILACSFLIDSGSNDDDTERIGIIGAMENEVANIKGAMHIERTEKIADMEFCVGTLDEKNIVVVQCGMGKVNAGICAQTLISQFNVKAVINTGVAGSLDNRLDIGDFVVSTDAVQHDYDVSPIGYQKGEIPYTGLFAFKADETLRAKAAWAIELCLGSNMMEGRVCSGDQFVSTQEQKERIISDFGGLCCEMEGGAIAQACYLNDVPFVIIRAVSDKADASIVIPFEEFSKKAAVQCSQLVCYMIEHYDESPST